MLEGAINIEEAANRMGRTRVRQDLVDTLKYEIDSRKPITNPEFITCCVEWQACQPPNTPAITKTTSRDRPAPYKVEEKGGVRCFKCGKQGHLSKQCWATPSREPETSDSSERFEKSERSDRFERSERYDRSKQTNKEAKQLKCFMCNKPGHKSIDCPERKANCRRVESTQAHVTMLKENETMVSIDGIQIPTTIDTGASVSLVPRELIPTECLTGRKQVYVGIEKSKGNSDGELANVTMRILDQERSVEVTAMPGERLGWVGALTMSLIDREDKELLTKLADSRCNMSDEEVSYIPPRQGSQGFQGAVWHLSGEEESIPQLDNSVSITAEKPQLDITIVSLAQGDASLGKGDVGNFVVEEVKSVMTRRKKR